MTEMVNANAQVSCQAKVIWGRIPLKSKYHQCWWHNMTPVTNTICINMEIAPAYSTQYISYHGHMLLLCLSCSAYIVSFYQLDAFTHILHDCFTGVGVIIWLRQSQRSNPEAQGWIVYHPIRTVESPKQNKQIHANVMHILWIILWFIHLAHVWQLLS